MRGVFTSGRAAPGTIAARNAISYTRSQLQHAFKHAEDFGVTGNATNRTLAQFQAAIDGHLAASSTKVIKGAYRGRSVTHHVNPQTGLNVMQDESGRFLSGWKLSKDQFRHVMTSGRL